MFFHSLRVYTLMGLLLGSFLSASQALAQNQDGVRQLSFKQDLREDVDTRYFSKSQLEYHTIKKITVEPIETDYEVLSRFEDYVMRRDNGKGDSDDPDDRKDLGDIVMNVEKLIALGKKIWKIVEDGRPVVQTDYAAPVSVLPKTEDGPQAAFYQMANWSAPKAKTYRVSYENGFGMNVIQFDYTVTYQYGGTFEGKGAYLTGVDVSASNLQVSWGFKFNAKSELLNISNRGSLDDPLAGATMRIDYSASSVFRSISTSEKFHIQGNGSITHL